MNTAEQPPPLHIAVFPWLAFGHMIPLLELSKSLAKRGHQISYISTPRNISRLPKLPPNLSFLMHFIPLTLPKVPGLPDNAEATSDVPPEKVQLLKLALDGLQQPFANFLKEYSSSKLKRKLPDWIILDFATPWAASLASQFSIPCILFSVFNASVLTFLGPENELTPDGSRTTPEHFTVPPNWIPFPSNLAYSLHGATILVNNVYSLNASGMTDICLWASTLRACKLVAPRSCMELESEYLNLLQNLYNKPVIPVGLLQPSSSSSSSITKTSDVKNDPILQWLDKQEAKSVVYIAFGSEATLSIELLHELALGLEMSEFHFLWALRKPADFEGEVLPEGFEERTKERGVVTLGWVPQLDVLRHVSVGGFLTHSGWSSVIEALQFGHPLVLLPIFADQDINTRMVENRGFGVEVKRKQDGSFDREAVANALRLVMLDDDDGLKVRVKAKELSVVFADKERQEQYVDDFLQHLRDYKKQHA
ncbi:UDP-glucuronosyl/UDP-glucosyltransferase protein [Dioscorea alata]|uniref:UDP-glucuronosyl/UDP-glucosyltransferase protein n=1 Tax=Dioscorea alata TaxID=55571 RepID=A0ACB7VML6_DIOAL|nr:UDP-glucuronosyl/UDP-glucosyltransferase protein [Dioscorea alata]